MGAISDQQKVLKCLYDRVRIQNDTRYCTIPTIKKNSGVQGSNQYVLTLTDDLEMRGLITTRQAYKMSGGRLFQITASGIDKIERGDVIEASSAAWTGRIDVSQAVKVQIEKHLLEARSIIDSAKLKNTQKANLLAVIGGIDSLLTAPDPQWAEVLRLLRNPLFQGVTGLASLMLTIVSLIFSAS